MATFLVAHGAWSAGWVWKKMRPLLGERGHELFTPTYTGLGERVHLARPDVGLETHIADVLGVLEFEDLRNVLLIGHSYGGMVATAVADRVPERLAQLVYLDAFVPRNGQSLFDLQPWDVQARMREAAAEDTLSGHLRQAIHRSRRPLREIGREAGISTTLLCDFLEGERTLRSDVLDRLSQAAGVTISLVPNAGAP